MGSYSCSPVQKEEHILASALLVKKGWGGSNVTALVAIFIFVAELILILVWLPSFSFLRFPIRCMA